MVPRIPGHSTVALTADVYGHIALDVMRTAVPDAGMGERIGGSGEDAT
jgi:hypothetical protein